MKHLYHTALRLSILPILLFVLSVSCKDPTASRTYTVSFETNGGSTVKNQTVKEEKKVSKPDNPTRKGYAFGSWYRDKALTQPFYFDSHIKADIILYAKWVELITVSFQTNGGSKVDSITAVKGAVNYIKKPNIPTKENFGFAGWYTDNTLTKLFDFSTSVTTDITLYAKWGEPVTLSFESNKGSTVEPITIVKGFKITLPTPTKGKLTLLSWYRDNNLTQPFVNAPITTNITLYAKYGFRVSDDSFRKKLKVIMPTAFIGEVMDVSHTDVTGRDSLNVSLDIEIKSLAGIEYFTALTWLDCSQQILRSLDLTKNTKLEWLSCLYNSMSSLDLSKNTKLTTLLCLGNQLRSLDMRGMSSAERLMINAGVINTGANNGRKNPLTSLHVLDVLKDHAEIKEAKTNRGADIVITTYNSDRTTVICNNYDPNQGKCLDP